MTAEIGLYTGRREGRRTAAGALPGIDVEKAVDPSGYIPDQGLADAVNVALILCQPLLVTGEPGTGKTQLAFSVAWDLGLEAPLVFETKSTSVSRDLFYTFDNVARFQASHAAGTDLDPRGFMQFNALGLAIVRTLDPAERARYTKGVADDAPPRRSVVLIDEIDKAPRDFPNDILAEIENLYFRIPELGQAAIRANPALRPIVIVTSNSEKSLPDAFLRRCIYYNIPFPDQSRLEEIVLARLPGIAAPEGSMLADVLDFFALVRRPETALRKRPGTAELIAWVNALLSLGADSGASLRSQHDLGARTLSAIAKHPEDQDRTAVLFQTWVQSNA